MGTKPRYILALDQGTTSSRALLVRHDGSIHHVAQQEFKQHFPHPGWVEHNPLEIWDTQRDVIHTLLKESNTEPDQIQAIGITNQRETTILWDKRTGEPIYNAIVWQDRRTAATCEALKEQGYSDMVRGRTGLPIDPYFSGTKIAWILDHVAGAKRLAEDGFLAFGTVDSWLIWNLTGGQQHATDVTNASRSMLFNIHTLSWDDELLHLLDIPRSLLPTVVSSSGEVGRCSSEILVGDIPIAGVAGDQHAALFGQRCTQPGMLKNTYGTGAFLMMNTGESIKTSDKHLISTIAWKIGNRVHYALEGSVFVAGAVVQWLRDGLGIIESSSDIEDLASSVPDSGGVIFVPAFTGLGAPHWDSSARGSIFGITRGTTTAHLARAALDSIAMQSYDLVQAMQQDAGLELRGLRVDGGASANNLLMQTQANLLQLPLYRPRVIESTALGAAFLAGLATGFWNSQDELDGLWETERVFRPANTDEKREEMLTFWQKAVPRTRDWLK